MVRPGGGLPPADCLMKKGEATVRPIIRSAVHTTVHMWMGKWRKSTVVKNMVMTISETQA